MCRADAALSSHTNDLSRRLQAAAADAEAAAAAASWERQQKVCCHAPPCTCALANKHQGLQGIAALTRSPAVVCSRQANNTWHPIVAALPGRHAGLLCLVLSPTAVLCCTVLCWQESALIQLFECHAELDAVCQPCRRLPTRCAVLCCALCWTCRSLPLFSCLSVKLSWMLCGGSWLPLLKS